LRYAELRNTPRGPSAKSGILLALATLSHQWAMKPSLIPAGESCSSSAGAPCLVCFSALLTCDYGLDHATSLSDRLFGTRRLYLHLNVRVI
jgi:hypothetical protein